MPNCPILIGYTELAQHDEHTLHLTPHIIHSLDEYEHCFGGPAPVQLTVHINEHNNASHYTVKRNFLLYDSVKLYFANGGKQCTIVSAGGYDQFIKASTLRTAFNVIQNETKPILIPDAASLDAAAFQSLTSEIAAISIQTTLPDHRHNNVFEISCSNQTHEITDPSWIKTHFSQPLKLSLITWQRDGKKISLEEIDNAAELTHPIEALEEAIDNQKRIAKSITQRQRTEKSLTDRFHILLSNYLNQPSSTGENLPLHFLLLYLKSLPEMINNWICKCNLDEVLAGDLQEIIRNTVIPEIATQGLPKLMEIHRQAIALKVVDAPVTGYNEMFCLTSCIGSNCPWIKKEDDGSEVLLSDTPEENHTLLTEIFDHFDTAIRVVEELAEQFEMDAQNALTANSAPIQEILDALQQSRYVPADVVTKGKTE